MVLTKYLAGAVILLLLITSLSLWFLPASVVWRGLEADQHLPYGARVTLPRGTIREGNATLRFRTFPPSKLSWTLTSLFPDERSLALKYQVRLEGPNHTVDANVSLQKSGFNLMSVSGFFDSEDINQLAAPFGHQFSGRVDINLQDIRWNPQCVEKATGQIDWTGGTVSLNLFEKLTIYQLPAMTGNITETTCGLTVNLERNRQTLGQFTLTSEGWFRASIEPSLLRLAKTPNADQIKQPLLFEEKIL
jgi:hypothetical protein